MNSNQVLPRLSMEGSFKLHYPLLIGAVLFALVMVTYFFEFGSLKGGFWNFFSDDREHWGQFGDFVGGVLNPMIGLVTIWLVTKSLHQNSQMLAAAKSELELARSEIARGVAVQQATQVSLSKQIEIARQGKDFNAAIDLKRLYLERLSLGDLSGSDYKKIYDRHEFLKRYVDFQFAHLVDVAVTQGIDPAVDLGTLTVQIEGNNFVLFASVNQGWVRISHFTILGETNLIGYWVDTDKSIKGGYVQKAELLKVAAEAALRILLGYDAEIRMDRFEDIPGMFREIPNSQFP